MPTTLCLLQRLGTHLEVAGWSCGVIASFSSGEWGGDPRLTGSGVGVVTGVGTLCRECCTEQGVAYFRPGWEADSIIDDASSSVAYRTEHILLVEGLYQ